jgi:hypothetical protein
MHHARRPLLPFFVILSLAWHSGFAQSIFDTTSYTRILLFPQTHVFPHMYAGPLTHHFGVGKDLNSAIIRGSIGAAVPVLEVDATGTLMQFGAGATVLTSIVKKPRLLQVVTVDFLVEFPIDVKLHDQFTLRTGYGHFSAHFADDGIEILGKTSVNYAKDYLLLLGAWQLPVIRGTVYGGGHWDYHSIPEEGSHWTTTLGLETVDMPVVAEISIYAAIDIQWKSEVAWGTTQSYQAGIRLLPRGERALRIAYTYRTGFDERGQFFREQTDTHLIGVYIDF